MDKDDYCCLLINHENDTLYCITEIIDVEDLKRVQHGFGSAIWVLKENVDAYAKLLFKEVDVDVTAV